MTTRTPSFRILALLFFALVVGGIVVSVWVGRQQLAGLQETTAANQQAKAAQTDDIVSEDITITVTNGSAKQWELTAEQATYNRDRSEAELATVSGYFYGADNKPVAAFTAPAGHYTDGTKSVTLTGGVAVTKIENADQGLTAPTLVWSSRSSQVQASGGVVVRMGEKLTSRGQNCQFTLDFNQVRLSGGAQTEMSL